MKEYIGNRLWKLFNKNPHYNLAQFDNSIEHEVEFSGNQKGVMLSSTNSFVQEDGSAKDKKRILDAAAVSFVDSYAEPFIVGSIADGHGGHRDVAEDISIAELSKGACDTANREVASLLSTSLLAEINCNDVISEVYAQNKNSINMGAASGLTTYAAYSRPDAIEIKGFSVGDQMLVAYSPSSGFFNISPAVQIGGNPETLTNVRTKNFIYNDFKQSLPKDSVIIALTDGVFDELPTISKELDNRDSITLNTKKLAKQFAEYTEEKTPEGLSSFFETQINTKKQERISSNCKGGDDATFTIIPVAEVIRLNHKPLTLAQKAIAALCTVAPLGGICYLASSVLATKGASALCGLALPYVTATSIVALGAATIYAGYCYHHGGDKSI